MWKEFGEWIEEIGDAELVRQLGTLERSDQIDQASEFAHAAYCAGYAKGRRMGWQPLNQKNIHRIECDTGLQIAFANSCGTYTHEFVTTDHRHGWWNKIATNGDSTIP